VPRLVVVGTGTGVGKTFVTAALARGLAARGLPVQALKPVETGLDDNGTGPLDAPSPGSDADLLERAAAFHVKPPRPHPRYRFAPPISPHLAAARAGVIIDISELVRWAHSDGAWQDNTLHQIIETAGGAFSPLAYGATNFDLMGALEPTRVLLVAPDALGVIHDLTVTIEAMRLRGRLPDAVVLSQARAPDASTGSNAGELGRLGLPEPLCTVCRDADDVGPLLDWWLVR
jgi:dethiobiotin synthetase